MPTVPDRERDTASLDVLGQFAQVDEDNPIPGRRGILLTSVGFLVLVVLGSVGFVGGALWGAAHEPDLDYGNLAAEIAIKVGYAALWGVLVAAALVAVVLLAVGTVWIKGRLVARRTANAPEPRPVTATPSPRKGKPRHH